MGSGKRQPCESTSLEKGRPVRLRAYQAGLWGCYIIPDGSVGLLVASDRYETLGLPGSCPHDRGLCRAGTPPILGFLWVFLIAPRPESFLPGYRDG